MQFRELVHCLGGFSAPITSRGMRDFKRRSILSHPEQDGLRSANRKTIPATASEHAVPVTHCTVGPCSPGFIEGQFYISTLMGSSFGGFKYICDCRIIC